MEQLNFSLKVFDGPLELLLQLISKNKVSIYDIPISLILEHAQDAPAFDEKEQTMEKTLNVEGMMCPHCVAHVKKALEAVAGVESVDVNLEAKTATVTGTDLADETLVAAVVEAGYEAEIA